MTKTDFASLQGYLVARKALAHYLIALNRIGFTAHASSCGEQMADLVAAFGNTAPPPVDLDHHASLLADAVNSRNEQAAIAAIDGAYAPYIELARSRMNGLRVPTNPATRDFN